MEELSHIVERIHNKLGGVKAEIILADLIEYGFDPDEMVIAPVGTLKRPYSDDLFDLQWMDKESGTRLLYVYITREGLYDALPQGLFHQTTPLNAKAGVNSAIGQVKRRKEEEQQARNFFLPFEQEIYHQRKVVEQQERKLLADLKESSSNMFVDFWELGNCLDSKQKSILLNLIPLTYKIVGDFKLTSQCFEMVLGTRVSISYIEPLSKDISDRESAHLGKSIVGVNMVLGTSFNDGDPAIEIVIGPLKEKMLIDFLPGGRGREVLNFICDYFIPVELDTQLKILVDDSSQGSQFKPNKGAMRLGYNFSLEKQAIPN